MCEALDALLRDNPGVRPGKLVSAHIAGDNSEGEGEGVRGSRAFLDLARDPALVELVSGVIGDDVVLWGCHVFLQTAAAGLRDALAPGRPLLADPAAGQLHGLGRAGGLNDRKRLLARAPEVALGHRTAA